MICSLMGTSLQGLTTAEVSPFLPVLAPPLSTLNPSTSNFLAPIIAHLLIHFAGGLPLTVSPSILPSYILFTHSHLRSHHMSKPS